MASRFDSIWFSGWKPHRDHREDLSMLQKNRMGGVRHEGETIASDNEPTDFGVDYLWAYIAPKPKDGHSSGGGNTGPAITRGGSVIGGTVTSLAGSGAGVEPAELGGWSMVHPFGHSEGGGTRVLKDAGQMDYRFEPWSYAGLSGDPSDNAWRLVIDRDIPGGTPMLMVPGTEENNQRNIAWPFLETVADHRGGNAPDFSTPLWDIKGGSIDWEKGAGLHTHLWVKQQPEGTALSLDPDYVAAWNLTKSAGDGTGYGTYVAKGDGDMARRTGGHNPMPSGLGPGGHVHAPGFGGAPPGVTIDKKDGSHTLAEASWEAFGPFHPGHAGGDKHKYGVNDEGEALNSGHLWTNAYFYMDQVRDAPLEFDGKTYPICGDRRVPTKTWIRYDETVKHTWKKGTRPGLWRLHTTDDFDPSRPPYITRIPPTDRIITPGGEGVPGWPHEGITIRDGEVVVRGPNGEGVVIRIPNGTERVVTPGAENTPENEPGLDPTWPHERERMWNVGYVPSGPEVDRHKRTAERQMAPMRGMDEIAFPSWYGTAVPWQTIGQRRGRFGQNRYTKEFTDFKAFEPPMVFHLQAFGKVLDDGGKAWSPTTARGELFAYATASGGAWFSPPEIAIDDDSYSPTSESTTYFGLHDNVRFGWGVPDNAGILVSSYEFRFDGTDTLTLQTYDSSGVAIAAGAAGDATLTVQGDVNINNILNTARLGVNTATVPHGGVGGARLAIEGTASNVANGPHVQVTVDTDDYPVYQQLNFAHGLLYHSYDAYYDGAWKSSTSGSNYSLGKVSNKFKVFYDSGVAAGSGITWNTAWSVNTSGDFWLETGDLYFGTADQPVISKSAANQGTLTASGKWIVSNDLDVTNSLGVGVAANGNAGDIYSSNGTQELFWDNSAGLLRIDGPATGANEAFSAWDAGGTQRTSLTMDGYQTWFTAVGNIGYTAIGATSKVAINLQDFGAVDDSLIGLYDTGGNLGLDLFANPAGAGQSRYAILYRSSAGGQFCLYDADAATQRACFNMNTLHSYMTLVARSTGNVWIDLADSAGKRYYINHYASTNLFSITNNYSGTVQSLALESNGDIGFGGTAGAVSDTKLRRGGANILELASGDSFRPEVDAQTLGAATLGWQVFLTDGATGAGNLAVLYGSDTDTGEFLNAAGDLRREVAGVEVQQWQAAQVTVKQDFATNEGRVVETDRYTANQTLDDTNHTVLCVTAAGFTVTLPSDPTDGRQYYIKNTNASSANVTVGRNGNEINNAASDITLTPGQAIIIIWEATEEWQTFAYLS